MRMIFKSCFMLYCYVFLVIFCIIDVDMLCSDDIKWWYSEKEWRWCENCIYRVYIFIEVDELDILLVGVIILRKRIL